MSSHLHWRKQLLVGAKKVDGKLLGDLRAIVGQDQVLVDEPMSKHTTYRIGGPADVFVQVADLETLIKIQSLLENHSIDVTVLGGGSNMLVQDGGLRGVVINLGKGFEQLEVESTDTGHRIHIGAAASLGRLIKAGKEHGWKGLAPIAGTPGTVGGALRMNAGGRDVWIDRFVESADVVLKNGELKTLKKSQLGYEYRRSKLPPGAIIISGTLVFETDDVEKVRGEIEAHIQKRKDTQPLNLPNSGSVFRNPEHGNAGELIERAGLKGVRLHDAQISELHGNFIVNRGNAMAKDVIALMKMAKQKVYEETGIKLEEELRVVGQPGADDHE